MRTGPGAIQDTVWGGSQDVTVCANEKCANVSKVPACDQGSDNFLGYTFGR